MDYWDIMDPVIPVGPFQLRIFHRSIGYGYPIQSMRVCTAGKAEGGSIPTIRTRAGLGRAEHGIIRHWTANIVQQSRDQQWGCIPRAAAAPGTLRSHLELPQAPKAHQLWSTDWQPNISQETSAADADVSNDADKPRWKRSYIL